jgi:predicted PurR-regulated permease PerM
MAASSSARRVPRSSRSSVWPSRDILRAGALVLGLYLALQFLWEIRSVACLGVLGVLLGLALAAGVDRFARRGVPRGVAALLIVLLGLGALGGLVALAAPRIGRQLRELREQVPQAIGQVERWLERRQGGVVQLLEPPDSSHGRPAERPAQQPAVKIGEGVAKQLANVGQHFFAVFSSTLALLGGLILVLAIAIYVAVDPGLYRAGLMHLFPHRSRRRAGEVLSAVSVTLRRWLVAQLVAMAVIGVVTTGALLLIGVRAAVALGIIAGLLEFVPYVGPILSAVPAIAMALLDGPEKALWVAAAYTVIQQSENHLLIPLLMKEGVDLPPVLTILAQAAFAIVFGFFGLLVAVPLLGALMVPVKLLYVEDVVGDDVAVSGAGGT